MCTEKLKTKRSMLIHFLLLGCFVHALAGMAMTARPELLAQFLGPFQASFWATAVPQAAHQQLLWWLQAFGATLQMLGLCMTLMVWSGRHHRQPTVWLGLALALLLWAPQDICLSWQRGIALFVSLDLLAVLALLPPLLLLYFIDKRGDA
ncbi:cell division protein [Leeia aquatica]|uniref:Cell division protein n=1 Tax=Leeia aquatica TaxID=2725557 RepID=A0A847S8N6_9NEIS|nr:cell division protein [Leeia aquatica]NLR73719.1 cell division protein [Leeia aquatica]